MPSIPAAVAAIQAHPAPVVFLDTCALLDIVRAPNRGAASTVEAATELLTGANKNPATVYLVIGCPTPTEWDEHVDEAVADCAAAITSVNAVAQTWEFLGVAGIPVLPMHALPLPDRLKDLSKELLNAAILLDKDADALSRAIDRVINSQLPARKGGKGAKDSVILEHAIGLTDALRNAELGQICVFASSNTHDFAASGATTLHPLLQPDFDPPTDLQYAFSLFRAVTILKGSGWAP
jgi:hypothetical protein